MGKEKDIVPMWKAATIIVAVAVLVTGFVGGGFFLIFMGGIGELARLDSADGAGDGKTLDGVWEIDSPAYNGEVITVTFSGNSIIMVTETVLADSDFKDLAGGFDETRDFYRDYNGGTVEIEDAGDGNALLRVTVNGTFTLTENELRVISGEDILTIFPFSWTGTSISINSDSFTRRL